MGFESALAFEAVFSCRRTDYRRPVTLEGEVPFFGELLINTSPIGQDPSLRAG